MTLSLTDTFLAETNGSGGWTLLSGNVWRGVTNAVTTDFPQWTNTTLPGISVTNEGWFTNWP
jgi:hypothetical protein